MKRRLLVLFCLASTVVYAQSEFSPTIKAIARVKKDTVILRWGPTTPLAWEIANQFGYTVKRYTVFKDGVLDTVNAPPEVVLNRAPLKPLPLDLWEPITQNDSYAAIAAQALYGKSFVLSNPSTDAIRFYNQTEDKESRYSFALFAADHSAVTAQALGLRLVDTSIKKNEKYVYRIFVAGSHPQYQIDPGTLFVNPDEIMELPAPEDLKAEFGDQSVRLSWKSFYLQDIYVSYKVERSDDEGNTFKSPTDQVFLNTRNDDEIPQRTFYVDSLPSNYKIYFYRVRGITPFGEQGPPSEAVKGVGLGSAKGAIAVIDMTHAYDDGKVYLQWRFPNDLRNELKGFMVAKGKSAKGPFVDQAKDMISPGENHFVDENPYPVNYYVIRAMSNDGTVTTSFPALVQLEDSTPPSIPKGVSGKVNQDGIVTLEWASNEELDLAGYRVYKANHPDEEFVQVTRDILIQNKFTDTLNIHTLTRNACYKVVAFDNRYNASDYSEAVTVQRPDIVPPSATQFVKAYPGNNYIDLEWMPGANDDISVYKLFRAAESDTVFTLIREIKSSDSTFSCKDTNVTPGNQYIYKLVVVDEAGLTSPPAKIIVNAIDYGVRPPITKVRYGIDRDKRFIKLEWEYVKEGISGYQVYKARDGAPLRLYKFVPAKSFQDRNLTANSKYIYAIKAIYEDGAESELSKEIEINY